MTPMIVTAAALLLALVVGLSAHRRRQSQRMGQAPLPSALAEAESHGWTRLAADVVRRPGKGLRRVHKLQHETGLVIVAETDAAGRLRDHATLAGFPADKRRFVWMHDPEADLGRALRLAPRSVAVACEQLASARSTLQ